MRLADSSLFFSRQLNLSPFKVGGAGYSAAKGGHLAVCVAPGPPSQLHLASQFNRGRRRERKRTFEEEEEEEELVLRATVGEEVLFNFVYLSPRIGRENSEAIGKLGG